MSDHAGQQAGPYQAGVKASGPRPNPLGVAALIVGIVAFVGAFIPLFNYLAVLIGLVGLVLGLVALFLGGRRKAAAIAGTIVSFVGLAAAAVLAVVYTFLFFGHLVGLANDESLLEGGDVPLVYQVDGTGSDVDITYTSSAGGVQATEQVTGRSLPFEEDFTVGFGGADTYASYTITAVNGAEGGDVICRIILNGTVLAEETATGAFSAVTCTASGTELLD